MRVVKCEDCADIREINEDVIIAICHFCNTIMEEIDNRDINLKCKLKY